MIFVNRRNRPPCAERIPDALAIDNSTIFAARAIMPARRAASTRNSRVLLLETFEPVLLHRVFVLNRRASGPENQLKIQKRRGGFRVHCGPSEAGR